MYLTYVLNLQYIRWSYFTKKLSTDYSHDNYMSKFLLNAFIYMWNLLVSTVE